MCGFKIYGGNWLWFWCLHTSAKAPETEVHIYMLCTAECECSVGPSSSCTACVAQQAAHNTLHKVFGFSEFRSGQLEAILPALHGRDTFVRMATGSGKSLCMFIVPLVQSDTAMGIVISPLNSLMDEQVKLRLYAANYVHPQSLFSHLWFRFRSFHNLGFLQLERQLKTTTWLVMLPRESIVLVGGMNCNVFNCNHY